MGVIHDFGMPFTDSSGDRKYSSSAWREYFSSLLENGIIGQEGNELEVKPQAVANKSVYVDTGSIFIEGAIRVLQAAQTLTFSDNTSGNPRIDRVVARLDYTSRKIEFAVLQGTPAASPVAPLLTRDANRYEIALADALLSNGYSTITGAMLTDKRTDEALCGYFKYKAKPAWYPGGSAPLDAWMYTCFKSQLTALEIADIEANPSIMSLVYASNSIQNGYKDMMILALKSYVASDVVISANTTLSQNINIYNNLTINEGVTLSCLTRSNYIIVQGTLTLNGSISASGKGGAGGYAGTVYKGDGGAGGGVIYLFANRIIGTGSIRANANNGTNVVTEYSGTSSGSSSIAGADGSFLGFSLPAASRIKSIALVASMAMDLISIGGGGGMSGEYDGDSTTSNIPESGAGVYGAGVSQGSLVTGGDFSSAGGGGGGGVIILISPAQIPAITLEAKGGNGGSALVDGGGGHGGGGGYIAICAPSNLASSSVAAGIGGNHGSYSGGKATDGSPGLLEFHQLKLN